MKVQIAKATIQQFSFGDVVDVSVGEKSALYTNENVLRYGKVIKIHLAPNKITYDLEFDVYSEGGNRHVTRIHNVDGSLLEPSTPFPETEVFTASPFSHGGWDDSTKHPGRNYKEWKDDGRPDYSVDVLIDLDGNRKTFRVGYYDFSEKKWIVYDEAQAESLEIDNMKWTSIPLAD